MAFETVDGQLEQAARVLGVSEAGTFFRVTLPLAWRGIMAGVVFFCFQGHAARVLSGLKLPPAPEPE